MKVISVKEGGRKAINRSQRSAMGDALSAAAAATRAIDATATLLTNEQLTRRPIETSRFCDS